MSDENKEQELNALEEYLDSCSTEEMIEMLLNDPLVPQEIKQDLEQFAICTATF